ncbi:MAG: hypothetical protein ACKVPX_12770 [Myxococcaceae bacterium]
MTASTGDWGGLPLGGSRVARRQDLSQPVVPVAPFWLEMRLDGWLRDPFSQGILYQLDNALGGSPPLMPTVEQVRAYELQLKGRVLDALRWGRLIAWEPPQRSFFQPVDKPKSTVAPEPEPPVQVTTWVSFQVLEDEAPLPRQKFRISLSDGSSRHVTTDSDGRARLDGIPPGTCIVTLDA